MPKTKDRYVITFECNSVLSKPAFQFWITENKPNIMYHTSGRGDSYSSEQTIRDHTLKIITIIDNEKPVTNKKLATWFENVKIISNVKTDVIPSFIVPTFFNKTTL